MPWLVALAILLTARLAPAADMGFFMKLLCTLKEFGGLTWRRQETLQGVRGCDVGPFYLQWQSTLGSAEAHNGGSASPTYVPDPSLKLEGCIGCNACG
jgi:hypothetical protein